MKSLLEYQRERRRRPDRNRCDCGNKATVTLSGAFICERCLRLQKEMITHEHKAGVSEGRSRVRGSTLVEKFHDSYYVDEPIIYPETLRRLEERLALV